MRSFSVRRIVVWLLVVLVLASVAVAAAALVLYARADVSTIGTLDFRNELRIPPLLNPVDGGDGRKRFRLELQAGTSELMPGRTTETWGVNGPYLAPTLRASRGDRVRMEVRNRLPESTTVHWHGMHLPAKADGTPHQPIAVGATWYPEWTVDQPAATLWYHPHPHGRTGDHAYRGVVGLFILDDARSRRLPLPSTYGVDDIPIVIQDKKLEQDGALDDDAGLISPIGLLGDVILVNGTFDPHLEVVTELVRLRVLNASHARHYNLRLADGRPFHLIATDGGLLEAPVELRRLQLSPAERAELLVRVEPGERIVLRSDEPELGTDFWNGRFSGGDDSFDLLQLRAADRLRPSPSLPSRLVSFERLADGAEIARTRTFELSGQGSINGEEYAMERIDAAPRRGTTELWDVRNRGNTPHNFHVHDVQFQVVRYAGRPPLPPLAGWKDTVFVPPGESVRLAVRFTDYADSSTPYMLHCHLHQHQDRGMMAQFVVKDGG